ncbi:MAG: restriction endonuclease subunit S [Planctomycetota bacterium]
MTDWPVKTLGDICRIEMGRTPSRGDSKGWDEDFKTSNHWASIADLTACSGGLLTSTKERISDFAAKTTKVVPAGTLLMSFKLSIGKLAFAGCDLYTNEAIAAFHLPEQADVDPVFLYWALSIVDWSALTKGSEKVKGATMNKAKLNLLEIPVPPLEEQKRIVELLDVATARVTELTACYEQARTHASNLFESACRSEFDDQHLKSPIVTLPDVSKNLDGRRKPITKSDRESGDVPYYGASGIVDYVKGHIFDEPTLLISEDGANLLARSTPIAFKADGKYWVNNHAHVVKFDSTVTETYVEIFLNSIPIDNWVTGAAQPKLTQAALNRIPIPIPPMDEQMRIVARLESMRTKTSEMVDAYDAKLSAAKNLRQSILEAAFAGVL